MHFHHGHCGASYGLGIGDIREVAGTVFAPEAKTEVVCPAFFVPPRRTRSSQRGAEDFDRLDDQVMAVT